MGRELSPGETITTSFGETWTIKKKLSEGGQGYVYLIENSGGQKVLKWYKPRKANEELCEHLRKNVNKGAPSSDYIWPLDIVERGNDEFGYIMNLRPEGYFDLTDILRKKHDFSSFKRIVDVALSIANDLRILHNQGYCYQDLNDGNFFVDPIRGKVLICDNDNVSINGISTGMLGKSRYMAPEVVRGDSMPDIRSDAFSMAQILFMLFTKGHPLEGKRMTGKIMTPELQMLFYGTDPVFTFDPEDGRNRSDESIHPDEALVWNCLPGYMKNLFIRALGKEGLMHPDRRPTEMEWIDALVRFRSNITECDCGNEVFIDENGDAVCDNCGKSIDIPFWFELPDYDLPGIRGSRIYKCQICITSAEETLAPIGRVISAVSDRNKLGIINESGYTWDALTTKGKPRVVSPKEVVPLKAGIKFKINESDIKIKGGK